MRKLLEKQIFLHAQLLWQWEKSLQGAAAETDNAVTIEFKVKDFGEEKSLEDTVDAAQKQIEEQWYKVDLEK